MANKFRPHFQRTLEHVDEPFEFVVLADEVGLREICASEIHALFDLKDQIKMMIDSGQEMAWTELVERAKETEAVFRDVASRLGFKSVSPKAKGRE